MSEFTCYRPAPDLAQERKTPIVDPIVRAVIHRLQERSAKGVIKYGSTLERDDISLDDWLIHLQEELLDAANYIEKLRQLLAEKKELFDLLK